MVYGILLLFDPKTEKHIQSMFAEMHRRKISSIMLRTKSLPHITLSVFKTCRKREIKTALKRFALGTRPFSVRFTKIGTFEGSNVVFLSPEQARLFPVQKRCLGLAKGCLKGILEHYLPRNITFHCTIGIGLETDKIGPGIQLVKKMGIPRNVKVTKVALYAVPDKKVPKVRQLFSVPLG
jgi:2'-5' RNA ligase